ncbi:hypothetical protein HD554DRAFT_2037504 [Boletus coccyginus]|nr:hypothetical protein HD554DRAFT_2037504 [Boletus coccyginus]
MTGVVVEIRAEDRDRWSDIFKGWCCTKNLNDLSKDVCIEGVAPESSRDKSSQYCSSDVSLRLGLALMTWLLEYEFLLTFLLFNKQKLLILCSVHYVIVLTHICNVIAKVLQQIKDGNPPVPIKPR